MFAPEKLREFLEECREEITTLLIVSQVDIIDKDEIIDPYQSGEFDGLKIGVSKAKGQKCERCWIYSETVGMNANHPTICKRCLENL